MSAIQATQITKQIPHSIAAPLTIQAAMNKMNSSMLISVSTSSDGIDSVISVIVLFVSD